MFSSFSDWWRGISNPVTEKAEPKNSQNIAFLESAPNIDPNKAVGGGDINMTDTALSPEVSPAGQTIAEIESDKHQGKASLYVVRRGDTLAQVAKMFDVTVNTIVWANDLNKESALKEGQSLVVLPVNGVQHIVKKGDTIQSIARKYNGDIGEILSFNAIEDDHVLSIGDVIVVPDGVESSVETPKNSNIKSTPKTARSRMIAEYPSYEGYYTHPFPTMVRKSQGIHGFNAVDLAGPTGEPIVAAAAGTVVVARNGWNGGYGNYVIIEHGNHTQTVYGHMSVVYVSEGASVGRGQPIGEVGSTGRSTGPHLHFEVRGAKNPF